MSIFKENLTSKLLHDYHFTPGLDFYGSFLAIKNNFKLNVFDDIEHLNNSEFFNKHKGVLFDIDEYEHLFKNNKCQIPIHIDHKSTINSQMSINSISDDLFDNVFVDESVKSGSNIELTDLSTNQYANFDYHFNFF